MTHRSILIWVGLSWVLVTSAHAVTFKADVAPLIKTSCIHCHDADTKTNLNLKAIGYDLANPQSFQIWEKIFDRVSAGEMPPKSEDRPDPTRLKRAMASLNTALRTASFAKQRRVGRVPARRLTKLELGYTLRDLLAIDGDVTSGVPAEVDSGSFDTVGATQRISAVHMAKYLQAADQALDKAIRLGRNPSRRYTFDFINSPFLNAFHKKPLKDGGSITRKLKDGVALFADVDYLFRSTFHGFHVRAPGIYRITAKVAAFQSKEAVTLKLIRRQPSGAAKLLSAFDLEPGKTETIVVSTFLKPGDDFYLTLHTGRTIAQDFFAIGIAGGARNYRGKGIAIKTQKVEGPLHNTWPPASTRRLLHGVKLAARPGSFGRYETKPSKPATEHVSEIVGRFAIRAFRRPPKADELKSFVALAEPAIKQRRGFAAIVRAPLRSMLTSPQFLLFDGKPGRLDDYALANRLSYFLWKSMPDDELFELARQGKLSDSKVLARQVERMLADKKSNRFVGDFLGQWLRLYKVNATTPDERLYPEYDELLGEAITREPELFFRELIKKNLSVTNLIDSDFTFLNRRLAEHYRIPGVKGQQFRRVKLPKGSARGGILTQAAILKTTANGTVTSPVTRGNFVLTNFLGTPPPPPPPGAGSIEPDTRGKTTIREILAAHRKNEACAKCHRKIDPPGFALESFDPIGGFRTHYRASVGGRRPAYVVRKQYTKGPPVDASGITADGKKFSGVREFKRHLLGRKERVAKHMISQLVVYSTGAEIQFADREVIADILNRTRKKGFPIRDVIHEVVQSRLFRHK